MNLVKHVTHNPIKHSSLLEVEKLLLSIENCHQSLVRAEEKLTELIVLYCQEDTDMMSLGLHDNMKGNRVFLINRI